jgi:flagellar protein FliO/FliZ
MHSISGKALPWRRRCTRWGASILLRVGAAGLLVLGSLALAHGAEQRFATPQSTQPVSAVSTGSMLQVTLSLVLVLAAVFAAGWLMRRLRGLGGFGGGAIEIVADTAVGAKERVVLVRVGNQQLLLGVAPGRVSTLHVLAEPVAVQPRTGVLGGDPAAVQQPARPDFMSILKRSLGL